MITFKFRLYPTITQEKIMDETLETCRRLYNCLLSDRIENGTGFYEQKKSLVAMKEQQVSESFSFSSPARCLSEA